MADSCSEEEKLRKQIAFLTQLISNAKSSTGGQNAHREKKGHSVDTTTTGVHPQISNPGQIYTRFNAGFCGSRSSSIHNRLCKSAATAERGNVHSKYSWSKTKATESETNLNRKENDAVTHKHMLQSQSTIIHRGVKLFNDNCRTKEGIKPTSESKKLASCDNINTVGPADSKEGRYRTQPAQTLSSISHSTKSPASSHTSIQQRIQVTEKAIKDLKKDLEKRTSSADNTASQSPSKKEQMHSLSPYKLQKLPSNSSSFTSVAKSRQWPLQKPEVLPEISSNNMKSSSLQDRDTKPGTSFSASPLVHSKYSLKRVNSAPALAHSSHPESGPQKQPPSKLLLKTRYTLKREKPSASIKNNNGKNINSHAAPSKYVNVSRYSLKRIRRSLSDESKTKKQRTSIESSMVGKNSNTQYAAHVIRTKYKVQKVYKGQPYMPWSSRYSGYQTRFQNTRPQWRARRTGYRSTRARQSSTVPAFYSYGHQNKKQFHKKQWRFSRIRQHAIYRDYKQHYSPSRFLQWRHRRLQYPSSDFISKKYVKRKLEWLKRNVPFDPKMKVDRRTTSPQKAGATAAVNMVVVNGMLYKSSGRQQTKTPESGRLSVRKHAQWSGIRYARANSMKTISVRGIMFSMGNDGKKLTRLKSDSGTAIVSTSNQKTVTGEVPVTRVDFGGVTYVQTKPGTLERLGSAQTRKVATRVVNRSVARVVARSNKLVRRQYCMFYNRFGKCNKATSCPYIHDPDKIAVCTRFLRGTCKSKGCPFSHKVSKEKMPVCSYFLKGVCSKEDCPYRHVNVNKDAEICTDFVKGYCPQGEKCKKKHILVCAEFSKTGKCKDGKKCKLQHRRRKRKSTDNQDSSLDKMRKLASSHPSTVKEIQPVAGQEGRPAPPDDSHLPFRERKLPAYISLNLRKDVKPATHLSDPSSGLGHAATGSRSQEEVIQIRPQL